VKFRASGCKFEPTVSIAMLSKRDLSAIAKILFVCSILLLPNIAKAQHHGGHGMGGGVSGASGRPTGVDEKDTLKDFHRALAVQATSEQIAEFQMLAKDSAAAQASFETFLQRESKANAGSKRDVAVAEIDKLLQQFRTDSHTFIDGFSPVQKSELKELLKKLGKAGSELEIDQQKFDEGAQEKNGGRADAGARAENLSKSVTDFWNQELAVGREMGIVLAASSDQNFQLAQVKIPVVIGRRTVSVTVSGELSQITSQGGKRTFSLTRLVDLSELQARLTEMLRAQVDSAGMCGERLEVREATIASSPPASTVALQLHYERRSCLKLGGQTVSEELAEADGSVEAKLTAVVEKANTVNLLSEITRINATDVMKESLRSGMLGQELRDKVKQSILSALETGLTFQGRLPLAVRDLATVQHARFQDVGVGRLGAVLEGQLELSDEQVSHLVSELNQAQFAQGSVPRESPSATPKSDPQR